MGVASDIDRIYRAEAGKVLATLVRALGDLDIAEEALHDAFSVAFERWPRDGVPRSPRAWLITTARYKGIDALRKRGRGEAASRELAALQDEAARSEDASEPWEDVSDDQLRLVFMCCHPTMPSDGRVALCLREVCGLRTDEIARCFLVSPAAMKRRLSRAKAALRESGVRFGMPARSELPTRLSAVLHVIYLVFNEGYAATSGDDLIRHELTGEAIFLARLVAELIPEPEALGLLALLLLHQSRAGARVDSDGEIVALEEQDRAAWDHDLIGEALSQLQRAFLSGRVGPYTIQAAIASVHASAPSVEATDWSLIVEYYDMLLKLRPGPVVELQRAVAVAMRDGPQRGLELVEALMESGDLEGYHSVHAVRADLARRLGRLELAAEAYAQAIALARQQPEKRYLQRQLKKIAD